MSGDHGKYFFFQYVPIFFFFFLFLSFFFTRNMHTVFFKYCKLNLSEEAANSSYTGFDALKARIHPTGLVCHFTVASKSVQRPASLYVVIQKSDPSAV